MDSATANHTTTPRAFLRWAGGKTWLVRRLSDLFGQIYFNRYHEPFLGGGSFFFAAGHTSQSFLSDKNEALIEAYQAIKSGCEKVIRYLNNYTNSSEEYYRIRSASSLDKYEHAAYFIYLNQTSFNGIYRVNLNGVYNVPYGHRQKNFLDADALRAASKALSNATLKARDFDHCIDDIKAGDLVFIDPPYTVSHNHNGFIKYNKSLFSLDDQYRLACFVDNIKRRDAKYITALIMVFGDVVSHLVKTDQIKPLTDDPEAIVDTATTYLDGLKPYFDKLTETERAELRKKYGSGAPTRLRRIFQKAINAKRDDFVPHGLVEYWRDQSKLYNVETYSRVADIELKLRDDVKVALMAEHGNMWLKRGMSEKLYTHLATEAARKNRKIENDEEEKTPWDCLNLIHIREIMMHGAQWSTLFQKEFTIPGEEGRKKDDKTGWLVKMNSIRNNADHEYSVSKEDADYVAAVHDWLIIGDPTAISGLGAVANSPAEPSSE